MSKEVIWGAIGSVVAAVVMTLGSYFVANDNNSLAALKTIIEVVQLDNTNLKKRVNELEDSDKKKTAAISEMKQTIMLLESSHQDSPLPQWLKDTRGVMLSVNAAYEEMFLIPRGYNKTDYLGKKDISVWPRSLTAVFEANDRRVLRTGMVWHGFEEVIYKGEVQKWRIVKYVRYSGRTKIGIAGIAIPPEGVNLN